MIRMFSKLRRLNLRSGKFLSYFKYAVGEIVLIIIGIMIALYLNEKSTDQDRKKAFDTALSQIYTNLQMEKGWYSFFYASYENQSRVAHLELNDNYELPPDMEPMIVGYMNSLALGDLNLADEAILSALHNNITSEEETILVNKISSHYLVWKDWDNVINGYKIRFLDDLFDKYHSPFIENYILFDEGQFGGNRQYTDLEIEKAKQIRSDADYKTAVLSVVNRNKDLLGRYDWKIRSIQSIIDIIREHDPEIPLTFKEIGLFGTAVQDSSYEDLPKELTTLGGSFTVIPMELSDPVKAIWEKRISLKDGGLRFREGNSALVHWGSTLKMDGNLLYSGREIPVKAGVYDVRINLTDLTYSFTQVNDGG